MADNGDPRSVDVLIGLQVIDCPLQAPGPGGDGAPVVRPGLLVLLLKVRLDALADVRPVRVDVAAIECGDGVTSINRLLDGPHVNLGATTGLGRVVVFDAGIMAVDPCGRQGHTGVLD